MTLDAACREEDSEARVRGAELSLLVVIALAAFPWLANEPPLRVDRIKAIG